MNPEKLETRRRASVEKYAPALHSVLQSGEQLQAVVGFNPHQRLNAPPSELWAGEVPLPPSPAIKQEPTGAGQKAAGVALGVADFVTGSGYTGQANMGKKRWVQWGVRRGDWNSQAGQFRVAAFKLAPGPVTTRLKYRAVVTDRRFVVLAMRADWDEVPETPEPVIAEFTRTASGVHTRLRRLGTRVDLVFADGSWFSLDSDIHNGNKMLHELLKQG